MKMKIVFSDLFTTFASASDPEKPETRGGRRVDDGHTSVVIVRPMHSIVKKSRRMSAHPPACLTLTMTTGFRIRFQMLRTLATPGTASRADRMPSSAEGTSIAV